MRVIAASLLIAAPALVSAAVTPVRRSISGFATFYYTQTGNPYVTRSFAVNKTNLRIQRFLRLVPG